MIFRISVAEIAKRRKNILLGLLFSIGLAVTLAMANATNQEKYNDMLLGSVVFFLVFANIINATRHLQWQKQIKTHRIEVGNTGLMFIKGDEQNELLGEKIANLKTKEKNGLVTTIFVELATGNKIRLEGYDGMTELAALIQNMMPPKVAGM